METLARVKQLQTFLARLPGRSARPASNSYNLLKTLFQLFLFTVIFLLAVPVAALRLEDQLFSAKDHQAGQVLWLVGSFLFGASAIVGWTSAYFLAVRGKGTPLPLDSTRSLVTDGPYGFVRNPIAFSFLVQGAAIGLIFGSTLILTIICVEALLWNFIARPWEEADLQKKFGAEYEQYRDDVRCWAPRLRPYCPDSHVTASRSTITTARTGSQIPFDRISP